MNLQETLNAIGRGDDQAMTRLYRQYSGFVYGFVRHRMGNHSDVEEVVQDVFLAVARQASAFQGNAEFTTYLCGIARHKIADRLRSPHAAIVSNHVDLEDPEAQQVADPNADSQLLEHILAVQTDAQLRHCMDGLPDVQREAFFWAYFEDQDLNAIAQHMACAVGTIKSRLFHARQSLMRCLARWYREVGHAA